MNRLFVSEHLGSGPTMSIATRLNGSEITGKLRKHAGAGLPPLPRRWHTSQVRTYCFTS